MTLEQFKKIAVNATQANIILFYPYLVKYMAMFDIVGVLRESAFIANALWESGNLKYTEEIASGKAYEGRKDLGNLHPGDGVKYKGHGIFQITGEDNHRELSIFFGEDFVNHPELLEEPRNATKSACWWFKHHGLNELADQRRFNKIVSTINGGYKGLAGRTLIYEKALTVLTT
jgi:putative chitinase